MAVESKKQVKRNNNPGVRVLRGRIYDSSNGTTCHQCRQKTMDFTASCKAVKKDKLCSINYCHKCLLNRYGEKAEDVASLHEWTCPKCRGICNCSCCMKKRGHQPTGIMVHTAKATGFSSVSELLHMKGHESFSNHKTIKPESLVSSPRKLGKENSFEGKLSLQKEEQTVKLSKKAKRKELKEVNHYKGDKNGEDGNLSKKQKKSQKIMSEEGRDKGHKNGEDGNLSKKKKKSQKIISKEGRDNAVVNGDGIKRKKASYKLMGGEHLLEAQLPEGSTSICISGIDLPPEDAASVLQFLEFCLAFGKILDLRKGQAECAIRELLSGRGRRRQQYSIAIKMIIQLLCIILEDRGEKSLSFGPTDEKWFKALGECINDSEVVLDDFPSDVFDKGMGEYEKMDTSKKLKLLNFLCDEALCTTALRKSIGTQNLESAEVNKEAKEKVAAAKEKEKQLRQKLRDEKAKALIMNNGAPLTIADHAAFISQIESEVQEAHAEMVAAIGVLPNKRQRRDTVRTEPVIYDDNGRVFWRLNSYNEEPNILLQEMGARGSGEVCPNEKWFAFKSEQKEEIDKYISCLRKKQQRAEKSTSVSCSATRRKISPKIS